jgi:hypothetical protein
MHEHLKQVEDFCLSNWKHRPTPRAAGLNMHSTCCSYCDTLISRNIAIFWRIGSSKQNVNSMRKPSVHTRMAQQLPEAVVRPEAIARTQTIVRIAFRHSS